MYATVLVPRRKDSAGAYQDYTAEEVRERAIEIARGMAQCFLDTRKLTS
jgi:hypothetical protein